MYKYIYIDRALELGIHWIKLCSFLSAGEWGRLHGIKTLRYLFCKAWSTLTHKKARFIALPCVTPASPRKAKFRKEDTTGSEAFTICPKDTAPAKKAITWKRKLWGNAQVLQVPTNCTCSTAGDVLLWFWGTSCTTSRTQHEGPAAPTWVARWPNLGRKYQATPQHRQEPNKSGCLLTLSVVRGCFSRHKMQSEIALGQLGKISLPCFCEGHGARQATKWKVPSLTSYTQHRALQVPRWLLERQKALESAQIYTDLQNLRSSKISYSCCSCESLIHPSTKSQKLLAHGLADAQEPERNKDQPSEAHLPHCASPGEWVGDP